MDKSALQWTIVEVKFVYVHKKMVNDVIGPKTVQTNGYLESAVGDVFVNLHCLGPAAPKASIQGCHVELEFSQTELPDHLPVEGAVAEGRGGGEDLGCYQQRKSASQP